jgi:hypothetical protein
MKMKKGKKEAPIQGFRLGYTEQAKQSKVIHPALKPK